MRSFGIVVHCSYVAVLLGCTGGATAVKPPEIDPSAAASAAIEQYDQNGDGSLSAEEIEDSALSLQKWDADQSGGISQAEIEQRLERYLSHGTGMAALSCYVVQRGRPLADAKVTLKPEEFLGGALHPAFGTTGSDGLAVLSVAEEHRPETVAGQTLEVVQVGLYTVEITHPTATIKDVSPSGVEVTPFEEYPNPTFEVR